MRVKVYNKRVMIKKILFYTDTPHYGGAEKQMELLAKHLHSMGCRVDLACGTYSELHRRQPKVYQQVHSISTLHKHDPRYYLGLRKLLENEKFDLVHIHLWNPGSCRYAFLAAHYAGLPIVTTEHDPFLLSGIKGIIKQKCLQKTNQAIVISSNNYHLLKKHYRVSENKLNLVHNGIDLKPFLKNKSKTTVSGQKKLILTCVAEFHPRKGHQYLIEAFQNLKPEFPNLTLQLVGKGPAEKELKEKYAQIDGVKFMGFVDDIAKLMADSDLFILPSPNEAFGLVILESMASGTLVIASNAGGPKDIIESGVSGYLFEPKNSHDLANKIKLTLSHLDLKSEIEKNALEIVQKYFEAKIMFKKTVEVYEKISDF